MAFKTIKEKLSQIIDIATSIHRAFERKDKDGKLQDIDISSEEGMIELKKNHSTTYSALKYITKTFSFLMKLVSFFKEQNIFTGAISLS